MKILLEKEQNKYLFLKVDIETAAEYACEDVLISLELHEFLWEKFLKIKKL